MPPLSSRAAGEARHREVRRAALQKAQDIASAQFGSVPIRLDLLTATALQAFREQWESDTCRRYKWPWDDMAEHYRKNEPSRFEVSVWSGASLCGLALGLIRDEFCRVDYLEGSPVIDHPLKGFVAVAVTGAAAVYMVAQDKQELRLMNPIPEVVPLYESLGFKVANLPTGDPYCWWRN
jgi:hypothetical protein